MFMFCAVVVEAQCYKILKPVRSASTEGHDVVNLEGAIAPTSCFSTLKTVTLQYGPSDTLPVHRISFCTKPRKIRKGISTNPYAMQFDGLQ